MMTFLTECLSIGLDLDVHLTGAGGGHRLLIPLAMAMTMTLLSPVAVTKDDEADDVDEQTHPAHNQDHLWVMDLLRLDESLESLDCDGEAEGEQEHGVDQGPDHLCPGEAECVRVTLPRAQPENQHRS